MKLYYHYKNKPYKYLSEAKHSETLEDMVVYETRYENNTARLWVRPKNIFDSEVEKGVPRFRKVPLEIRTTTNVLAGEIKTLGDIMEQAFGEWDPQWFYSTFNSHSKYFLVIAYVEKSPVGFKIGYELDQSTFYSWLGGVHPDYRGLGVASDLMKTQHDWCRQNHYKKIQTKSQNRFRPMLILNLKSGFDIIGTHTSDEKGLKIILEKTL